MRLWSWKLLPYLPKSQLVAQKRECDLIWKDLHEGKKTNHILINYIWVYEDYEKQLSIYYSLLEREFKKRGIKFNVSPNATIWVGKEFPEPFIFHQDNDYLMACYWNLREKYTRNQKDFDDETWNKLHYFVDKELNRLISHIDDKLSDMDD